jgi:hypothetical protein
LGRLPRLHGGSHPLTGIGKGERVYVVGKLSATALRRLMKIGAIVVKAAVTFTAQGQLFRHGLVAIATSIFS